MEYWNCLKRNYFLFLCHESYKFLVNVVFKSANKCSISQKYTFLVVNFVLSVIMSGPCVQLVTTWTASDWALGHLHTYSTLTKHNAAIRRATPTVTRAVTIKMSAFRSTTRAGVNANRRDISWPASTKAIATTFTALKSSDAARWRNVILILLTLINHELAVLKITTHTENLHFNISFPILLPVCQLNIYN